MAPKILLQAPDPLKEFAPVDLSVFTIRNIEGDSLYCRLFKPANFSTSQKYPLIVYWYGGPHAQMILNSWNGGAGDYWFRYMSQRGFLVLTVDTRGSDNRGKAFEQSIFRKLGEAQMKDLVAALNDQAIRPYIDQNKMGLFGWSFGGFMTTDFMLKQPGIFKAAVAGGQFMTGPPATAALKMPGCLSIKSVVINPPKLHPNNPVLFWSIYGRMAASFKASTRSAI